MPASQPLPPGWEAIVDPSSGDTYYVNTKAEPPVVQWEDPRLSLPAPAPPAPSKSAGNPFASSSGSQPTSSTQTANVSLGSSFADRFSEHPTPTPLLQAQSLANSAGSRAPSPSQKTSAPANTSREQDDDLPPPYDDGVPLSNPQPSINSRGPSPSQPSSHAPVPSSSNIPDDPLGPLPQGWIKIWDKASGKWYFVDERQRPPVITWDDPRTSRHEFPPTGAHGQPIPPPPAAAPPASFVPPPPSSIAPMPNYTAQSAWRPPPGSMTVGPPAGYPASAPGYPPAQYPAAPYPNYAPQPPQPYPAQYGQPYYAPPVQYGPPPQQGNTVVVVQPGQPGYRGNGGYDPLLMGGAGLLTGMVIGDILF